jgi:ADP-dependent NAD(P)H-hydrate dehydratase / NAD(P)H-hydrate epimerase
VVTGSTEFPGAAVLGVEAALRTGVGMVRYLGDAHGLVLQRRPEAVIVPGRVQAWLLGSGIDAERRDQSATELLQRALAEGRPAVMDSGALDLVPRASGASVITPHFRELARVLSADVDEIAANPEFWCSLAAESLGVTVLLKGSNTLIAGSDGTRFAVGTATPWLASAGTGDVLAGILGALLATHADAAADDPALLTRLAATAAVIHAEAAERVSAGGPLVALDLAQAVSHTVAQLVATAR